MQAGDIIGVADNSWLSQVIRSTTGHGPISHVGIVTATAPCIQVTQAVARVNVVPLDTMIASKTVAYVMSPLFLTDAQREEAARRALAHVGEDYGYWDLLQQAMDAVFDTQWFCEHFATQASQICSMLVDTSEPEDGFDWRTVSPNSFWFAALKNRARWQMVELK